MQDSNGLDPSADDVDAALRLGFGGVEGSQPGEASVLTALGRLVGEAPRRMLREEECQSEPGMTGQPAPVV